MSAMVNSTQINNSFILGFITTLLAETGQYKEALSNAEKLAIILANKQIPKHEVTLADIYFQMGQYKNAKKYADLAVTIDPRNLDASRLKTRVDMALDSATSTSF